MKTSLSLGAVIGKILRTARIGNYRGSNTPKENDMKFVSWIVNRLKEPSTYAGVASLALALGLTDVQWEAISAAVAGLAGLAAVFLMEKPEA
jgi:hypothetical protein